MKDGVAGLKSGKIQVGAGLARDLMVGVGSYRGQGPLLQLFD